MADKEKITEPTSRLMSVIGVYLKSKGLYNKAECWLHRALKIDEIPLCPDHPKVAIRLNNMAQLLQDTNRLTEAEPLYKRALKIFEDSLGHDHPSTITVRKNLQFLQLLESTPAP
jgi:tetratricopeptide (TPR) repeat protein